MFKSPELHSSNLFSRHSARTEDQNLSQRALRRGRLRAIFRKFFLIAGVGAFLSGLVFWKYDYLDGWANNSTKAAVRFTGDLGLQLREIHVSGQTHTSQTDVLHVLNVHTGEPLLALDMNQLQTRLKVLPWIKHAVVSRQFPTTLQVFVEEKIPAARWQIESQIILVDSLGSPITRSFDAEYQSLPLLVGAGAASEGVKILNLLSQERDVANHIKALIRVGSRRWDVELDTGQRIKLPADDETYGPSLAWKNFVDFARTENALRMEVASFDLRLPGRIVMKMTRRGQDLLVRSESRI